MEEQDFGKVLIYQNEKGDTKIDVYFDHDDIWMTQKNIASLYQVSVKTINEHVSNIISDGKLSEDSTIRKFRIVQNEGTRQVEREVLHYDFKMILAVGYRVRSTVGMHFRNWASKVLTEYSKKGFAINDDRLKNPQPFGADYFDELLERIRDIRASEKRFYQKIQEIYKTSEEKLDAFLRFTGREVLENAGKISADVAKYLAGQQYEIYDSNRKIHEADIGLLEEKVKVVKTEKNDLR